jgi:uroporphyrinogen-III decarboxylase
MLAASMSSRERMLAALTRRTPDHVPCCFMIFAALRERCASQEEYVERQLALGLDAYVEIPYREKTRNSLAADLTGLPVTIDPAIAVARRLENVGGRTLLHKSYATQAGTLTTTVQKTGDWPHGDEVPLFDDFVIPRAEKFLVGGPADLPALARLLRAPTDAELRAFREDAAALRRFAGARGLLTVSGRGVGLEAGCWLYGMRNLMLEAIDRPEFVDALVAIVGAWNRRRMEAMLEGGVDLFVRRGWYEGADFWSPALFERFVAPSLTAEAALAHEAGALFGYIMTAGALPLFPRIKAAGVDVLIGVDPVQDKACDLRNFKAEARGELALWGGVNASLTVERGSEDDVARATREALAALGPDGFVLSPVDNVRDSSEAAWRNVRALVRAWEEAR